MRYLAWLHLKGMRVSEFIVAFLISYVLHGTGITIGYHRLLSHRSFKCVKPVEYFFVLAGYLAYEGSPIWWSAIHRAHHRYVDTPLDPHSPRYGVMHAYWGWLTEMNYPAHIDPKVTCPDIVSDPIYKLLECKGDLRAMNITCFSVNIAFRLILWACFGWQVALAILLASVAVLQIPLMLNVICHIPKLGYKNFDTEDDGVNVWWVGILGMGEGWHNNHHKFPGSARNGMRAYEFDLSYLIIRIMKTVGLVGWVNDAKDALSYAMDAPNAPKKVAAATASTAAAKPFAGTAATASSAKQPVGAGKDDH